MRNVDIDGAFWLEDSPEDSVTGRLTFDPVDGAELRLLGELGRSTGRTPLRFEDEPDVRIFGMGDGKVVTLLDCMESDQKMSIPGIKKQNFLPSTVLTGAHFTSEYPLEFNSIRIELNHLLDWVEKSGIRGTFFTDGGHTISYEPLDVDEAELGMGMLSMSVLGGTSQSSHQAKLFDVGRLAIVFDDPQPLPYISKVSSALRDLITIGTDSQAHITASTLTHRSFIRVVKDVETPESIEIYSRDYAEEEPRKIHRCNMLFSYDSIGGIEGVAKWLKVAGKYGQTIGLMLSNTYMPRQYLETRYTNMVTAAEGFANKRLTLRPCMTLQDKLEGLIDLVADVVPTSLYNGAWAKEVTVLRNRVAHGGSIKEKEFDRIFWLGYSLYFFLVVCLLRECDVDEDVLKEITLYQVAQRTARMLQATNP